MQGSLRCGYWCFAQRETCKLGVIVTRLENMAEEQQHGSLGRLAPEWGSGERNLTADDIYERFFGWVSDVKGIELWPHQEEAIMDILAGDHVILNTPTGSGKSMVALGMHFAALCTGQRSYYTAPIKALVSEKFFDLVEVFGRGNVGMITGDSHINADAPIICCTAEILANQALREGEHADIGLVAMDEFHYYGDPDRGWAWQVPLLTLPQTRFLLMSATLGNVDAIADKLADMNDVDSVDIIADAPRPVPLSYEYTLDPLERTVELAINNSETPIYVVHFSQDAALDTAQSLANAGVSSKEQRQAIAEAMKGVKFTTGFGKILQRLLRNGVGIHHAGMLPRYRRLVEQLAQQGLLPVICGTDTLGVGINVPIHSVVLTALSKYDGTKTRRLRAREFHQIAGRAGRMGFDTEGVVIAEAPEYDIENQRAVAKAGGDPKKLKKIKRKKAPEGFVGWNEAAFNKLIDAAPETLTPHLNITHSMVLNEVQQGGDARARIDNLIDDSSQTPEQKEALHQRADEIFQTLFDTDVIEVLEDKGGKDYVMTLDMPDDFALDQPLSPFLLAALELLDPESPTYALDVISMAEATLDDPRQVLRAQERVARDKARADMKMDGLSYEERMDRVANVSYPKPLENMLDAAFAQYRHDVPWANDYWLSPKSVVRDMVETASDFNGYISRYNIARSEGTLLRYLSDAYRTLSRTIPDDKRNEELDDIIAWLRVLVRSIDSSLVDEWEHAGSASADAQVAASLAAPGKRNEVVEDRRGLTVLVRNAMFRRVQLMDLEDTATLGALDKDWGYGVHEWEDALDDYYAAHDYVGIDAAARSPQYFMLDESHEHDEHTWKVRQIIDDSDGDRDWAIEGVVDLDATQDSGEVVFQSYEVSD